jgi:methyl-accepting chemotaxis protein
MLIKHKLIINTAILAFAMLIMLLLINYSVRSLEADVNVARKIGEAESLVLQLRRHEKDFIARKDMKYVEDFDQKYRSLQTHIKDLNAAFDSIDVELVEIPQLVAVLEEYNIYFQALVKSQQRIGLNPKDGLYGKLRTAVHDVEVLLEGANDKLLADMLQLRRNEKDFMLRLDAKYATRWEENANKFLTNVNASDLSNNVKGQIISNISLYQSSFENLVAAQKELGFDANSGIQGQMRASVHKVDKMVESVINISKENVSNHTSFVHLLAYSVFTFVLVVAIIFAVFVSKSILSGITELNLVMNKVAQTQDLSIKVNIESNDEIGEMASIFNRMIASFRHLIVQVNQSVGTLNTATHSLSENIHVANEGVDEQIQQTDFVATAVTEMVATVEEIANNTHEAASKAESTNSNANEGREGVGRTIRQIDELSSKLLDSETVVHELAKDSDTIGSVLDVIRGIAEQTNLLALNAAIEAARAGEQGRGFAVVADEVRTLASRTQDSTQEIETIISSLQGRTKDIVAHMATCRTQGKESADQASAAGKMLEEITNDVTTIMEMSTAIATAIHQQSTVASEVNEHVVAIRDVAEQSGITAQHNAQMSEELSEQARVLNDEVSQFTV